MSVLDRTNSTHLRAAVGERIEKGNLVLPLLPDSAAQVLATCQEASCDSRKLAELIQRDPSLAGNVLRIANSAAYAPTEPIVSLHQAVARLGQRTLCDITIAAAMNTQVFRVEGRQAQVRELWAHSALSAAWSREVARMRRRNVESAFLCGLLHDVGSPVLLQLMTELTRGTTVDENDFQACLDEFHARVGAEMIALWRLPPWTAAAVRWHHDPAAAGDHRELAATTCLGDLLADWSKDPSPERMLAIETHAALPLLGLYADEINVLYEKRAQIELQSQAFA
jgi:HD-like signal output (HDOD) protein